MDVWDVRVSGSSGGDGGDQKCPNREFTLSISLGAAIQSQDGLDHSGGVEDSA